MPVVNPGIRRLLASAIQRLFNSASFDAPLTHTAVPTRAATSTTATFTRATTKTWPNNDGYLVTGLAGEIGFPGARRVDNLIRLGAAQSSTLAVAANVTMTLPAGAYQFSMGAGTGTATFSGTGGATGTLAASASARTFVAKTISAGTLIVTASVATLVDIQVVSMVAETDQTTPREYVSVGVESAPYYHGSCVDGVKCFPTDINGVPLTTMERYKSELAATNLAFKSNEFTTAPWAMIGTPSITKNATGVDGATSAWTVTVSQGDEYNQLGGVTLTAATYTRSIKIKKTTGAQSAYPVILVNAPATYLAAATIDTTNGTGTIWTAYSGWTIATSSVRVTSWNDNFWLVELTFLATAANWAVGYIGAMTTNVTKSSGSFADADVTGAAGTHVMQHLQLELGSKATSYIDNPNAAVSVTRNADILTYSGGDIPNLKTLMAGFRREVGVSNVGVVAALSDGTANERWNWYLNNATDLKWDGVDGGVAQWSFVATPTYSAGVEKRLAGSTASNDIKSAFAGTAQTPDTSATLPTVTQLQVGHLNGASQLSGNVGGIYGWTRNLSQSELNAVTA